MTEFLYTVLKVCGSLAAIVASVVLCSRLWRNAGRDKLINFMQIELDERRQKSDEHEKSISTLRSEAATHIQGLRQRDIEIAQLKARPDFATLADLMQDHTRTLAGIGKAFNDHSASDLKMFQKITTQLDKISRRRQ